MFTYVQQSQRTSFSPFCLVKGKYVIAITCVAIVMMLCVIALCICQCVRRRRLHMQKHQYDATGSLASERELLVESGSMYHILTSLS